MIEWRKRRLGQRTTKTAAMKRNAKIKATQNTDRQSTAQVGNFTSIQLLPLSLALTLTTHDTQLTAVKSIFKCNEALSPIFLSVTTQVHSLPRVPPFRKDCLNDDGISYACLVGWASRAASKNPNTLYRIASGFLLSSRWTYRSERVSKAFD